MLGQWARWVISARWGSVASLQFRPATNLHDWPFIFPVQKAELFERLHDVGPAVVEIWQQLYAGWVWNQIKRFRAIGHVNVPERMVDVGDLVKYEQDVHAGGKGRIESLDVYRCAEAVLEVGN